MNNFSVSKVVENSIEFDKSIKEWRIKGQQDTYSYCNIADVVASVEDVDLDNGSVNKKYRLKVKVLFKDGNYKYIDISNKPVRNGTTSYHDDRHTQERVIALFKTIMKNA